MSVRAYRVNKIEIDGGATFNLWQDTDLIEFLSDDQYYEASEENDFMEIRVDRLKQAVKSKKLRLEDFVKEAIKDDIAWAVKNGKEYVMYRCY